MKKIIVSQRDHELISNLIQYSNTVDPVEVKCRKKLLEELKTAEIRKDNDMPADVIRLNSTVTIKTPFGRKTGIQLVLPGHADLHRGKLSVTSPMGTALIGYRTGDQVSWHFPKGDEVVEIEEVMQVSG